MEGEWDALLNKVDKKRPHRQGHDQTTPNWGEQSRVGGSNQVRHSSEMARHVHTDEEGLKSHQEISLWIRVSIWIGKVQGQAGHGCSTAQAEPDGLVLSLNATKRRVRAETSFSFFSKHSTGLFTRHGIISQWHQVKTTDFLQDYS